MTDVPTNENSNLEGNCPYCNYSINCDSNTPGMNCPGCDNRVIVRQDKFLTLDKAKNLITKENFNPKLHVAEFRRECNACGKLWHSLATRELEIAKKASHNACMAIGDASNSSANAQRYLNQHTLESSLEQLKKCPECHSGNYQETVVYYAKK